MPDLTVLIGKQQETRTEDFSAMWSSKQSGGIYREFLFFGNKYMEGKRSREGIRGGHNQPGRALVYRARLDHLPV